MAFSCATQMLPIKKIMRANFGFPSRSLDPRIHILTAHLHKDTPFVALTSQNLPSWRNSSSNLFLCWLLTTYVLLIPSSHTFFLFSSLSLWPLINFLPALSLSLSLLLSLSLFSFSFSLPFSFSHYRSLARFIWLRVSLVLRSLWSQNFYVSLYFFHFHLAELSSDVFP